MPIPDYQTLMLPLLEIFDDGQDPADIAVPWNLAKRQAAAGTSTGKLLKCEAAVTMAKFYQLRISLDEIEPEIWRRVVVPSDITLDRLHDVIQICMGWNDSHLHRFIIDGQEYTDYFDDYDEGREEFETMYALGDLVKTKGTEFNYLYDYGDDWSHTVRYEKSRREPDQDYAITCEGGAMCCPPDDIGGVPGFEDFRRIMADCADDEYQDYLTWYGKPFDPKEFDRRVGQRNLARYLRWSRPRPIMRDYS